jgi:N-dimethylarginine dimethylaminohydrolase
VNSTSKICVYNEYEQLERVMLGPAHSLPPLIPINATQEFYYSNDPPILEKLQAEQENFVEAVRKNGVKVEWATIVPDCDQRDIRDLAAVIGTKLLICSPKENIRKCEIDGLRMLAESIDENNIVRCREGLIEGGDIIVDSDTLLIGIGKRTNCEAFEFVQRFFGTEFDIIPLRISGPYSLHLDTVFSIISKHRAIAYAGAFDSETLSFLRRRYDLIEVTEHEQFQLATNVLVINPQTLVADKAKNPRLTIELERIGINILDVSFSEANKLGGSFHCASLPLYRVSPQ